MSKVDNIHPNCTPNSLKSCKELGELVDKKNIAYSNAVGKVGEVLKIIYPTSISPNEYKDVAFIVRILDKLFRISSQKDVFEESPYVDIAGLGILGVKEDEK